MIFSQIFEMVNIGLVVLDKDLKVYKWNRWMESHSGITNNDIEGISIFEFFPNLNNPSFQRNCKTVLAFGNFSFFSQKLHKYFFPFKPDTSIESNFKYMQQNCTMGPLRDEKSKIQYLFISVHDVTEVAAYEEKLFIMSVRDGLTGVFNRRYFEGRLKEEFLRHQRLKRPLSYVIFDIDHFKKVNDTYGHQCGDYILKEVSKKVSENIRDIDIFARYGGEEFCCLLLEADLSLALCVAERLRKTIAEQKFNYDGKSIKITISLGVSEVKGKIKTPEDLVKKADSALYKAKETGRNKVEY